MKQSYKIFKLGKQAVSGVLQLSQFGFMGLTAVAVGVVLTSSELNAQTVTYWADWVLPADPSYTGPGYSLSNTDGVSSTYMSGASGSIDNNGTSISLELTGEVNATSVVNASDWYGATYNPASAYTDNTGVDNIGNGPNTEDRIAQTGYTTSGDKAHTLTFGGTTQQDVVMALWSLGNPSNVSSLLFTQDFEILSSDLMTKNITPNGYELEGYEGAGIIQFLGSYSSISWTVTDPEFYSAFNVGITNTPVTTTAGPVSYIPGVVRDITASGDIHTDLGNASPTYAKLNYVFNGGTLLVGANLSDAFTIKSGGGSVSVASGDTYTMSGVISNATGATGAFTKTDAGVLVLSGTNTYTGGTTVDDGILKIAADSALGDASGSITLDGGTLATTANITSARGLVVGSGNLETASGTELTLSGVISGTSPVFNKTGAGKLIVTGESNTYAGNTSVRTGTLDLDGSLASDVTVASGARIEGSGSAAGDLTSSGTVAPGNSPGTLSFGGDVDFASGNTFITELDGLTYNASGGAGSYDRLAVTGASSTFSPGGNLTAVLPGIATPTFVPAIGDAFRVVTTANATGVSEVSGAFSTVTDPTSGMPTNTRFDVLYGGNYVDLVLTPDDLSTFAAAYGIQNMVNAAQAFDGIRPAQGRRGDTDKDNFFYGLYDLNASELSLALLQSSGEIHAFALSDARDGWEAGVATVRSASANGDRNFWIDVSGADVEVDQDAIGSAYDGSTRDIWVGSDVYENEYVTLGVGVGVSSSEVSTVNSGNADTDTTSLVAYMRGKYGAFEYDGLFSINRSEIETTRAVALSTGSVSNTSTSTAKGNVLSGKIGYRHDVKADTLTGLAWLSGDVSSTKTDTFTEEGSSVTGLTIAGNSVKAANVGLGYTLNGSIGEGELAGANWSLGASVSEQISRGMPDVSRTASLHGANWNVSVPKAGDMTKSLRAGLVIPVEDNAGVSFNVSADKRAGSLSKAVSFGIFAQW